MFRLITRDLFKLLGRKATSVYFWLFLYSFLLEMEDNFFMCSYLRDEVFSCDLGVIISFISIHAYLILKWSFRILLKRDRIRLNAYTRDLMLLYLKLRYLLHNVSVLDLSLMLKMLYCSIVASSIFILNYSKTYYITSVFVYIIKVIISNLVIWYPIYKAYSIFGLYKSTRLNFIDLKNENIKRLKY